MKKTNFLLGALMLATTGVLTSCFSNDIPEIVITGSGDTNTNKNDSIIISQEDIHQSATYTFTVHTNVAAAVYVNDAAIGNHGTDATGSAGIGEVLKIKAVPLDSSYKPESIERTVALDANGKYISLTFTKDPTTATGTVAGKKSDTFYSITVEDAISKTTNGDAAYVADPIYVVNTVANQKEPYSSASTVAQMTVSNAVATAAGVTGGNFSIACVKTPITGVKQNLEDVNEWFPVLTLKCTPDGAQFGTTNPARITVTNKYFEKDMIFACNNDDAVMNQGSVEFVDKSKGGAVYMDFTHFSDHEIDSYVRVVRRTEEVKTIKTQTIMDVKVGNHTYNYFVYSGYDCNYKANKFITDYLDAKFGPKRYAADGQVEISNLTYRASVPYTVTQKVYTYDVYFGDLKVVCTVYGEDTFVMDTDAATKYDEIKHSGGAAW